MSDRIQTLSTEVSQFQVLPGQTSSSFSMNQRFLYIALMIVCEGRCRVASSEVV